MRFICPIGLIRCLDSCFRFLVFWLIHIFLFSLLYDLENTQSVKQKSNLNKRGDKRGFKVPAKIKNDSFSMKAGLSNFSSAAGGSNFFGMTLSHTIVSFYNESFSLFEVLLFLIIIFIANIELLLQLLFLLQIYNFYCNYYFL